MVDADAGYTGVEKRPEHDCREVIWQIAARRSTYKKLSKCSALYKAKRKIEKTKAQVRVKVEHPYGSSATSECASVVWQRTRRSWSRCSRCRAYGWRAGIY